MSLAHITYNILEAPVLEDTSTGAPSTGALAPVLLALNLKGIYAVLSRI